MGNKTSRPRVLEYQLLNGGGGGGGVAIEASKNELDNFVRLGLYVYLSPVIGLVKTKSVIAPHRAYKPSTGNLQ